MTQNEQEKILPEVEAQKRTRKIGALEKERARLARLAQEKADEECKRKEEAAQAQIKLEKLRTKGPCPAGYSWRKVGDYYRCEGGGHRFHKSDPWFDQ